MSHFLMEHSALLESIVWRCRQGVEAAYLRSYNFVSLMYDMTDCIAQCLVDMFTGPHLASSLWLSLSTGCDKVNSVDVNGDIRTTDSAKITTLQKTASWNSFSSKILSNNSRSCGLLSDSCKSENGACDFLSAGRHGDFMFMNISKLLRHDLRECLGERKTCSDDKKIVAEKFVKELCELLECVDVKHTNL